MADTSTIVPTTLPAPTNWNPANLMALSQPVTQAASGGGGVLDDISKFLGGGSLLGSLAGGGIGGIFSGIGSALAASAQRKQKEKLIQWQIQQAQKNLTPQALSQQGRYINPYMQQNTDTYQNAVMGNLLSKMGSDTLAKWGINANPVSSAGERGSTQNQLAQYSSPAQALLNKYGYGNG
jgi:hypothetical protein